MGGEELMLYADVFSLTHCFAGFFCDLGSVLGCSVGT